MNKIGVKSLCGGSVGVFGIAGPVSMRASARTLHSNTVLLRTTGKADLGRFRVHRMRFSGD